MVDPITLAAFIPAALVLNLTPGADMLFCLAQGMRSGNRAALAASAGISTGSMVHVIIAGAGLSAIVSRIPGSFDIIRWVGVCYLLWLAAQAVRQRNHQSNACPLPARNAFCAGLFVNLTNPKVILFVLAFVPQFVTPDAGPVLAQFIVFGLVLAIGGFLINGIVGIFASGLGARIARTSAALGWATGSVFAALALRLAVMERG